MADIARKSLELWAYQLVPALFPFMILSNIFLKLSYTFIPQNKTINNICHHIMGLSVMGFYIIFLGHICGYPLGAKMTADAYKNKQINKQEAHYLLTICNQSSPAFLEFYVASYALGDLISVPLLLFLFYFATYLTSLFTRHIYPFDNSTQNANQISIRRTNRENFFFILDQSISESAITILRIGGYVVIFSIISDLFLSQNILPENISRFIAPSFEITNGLNLLRTHFYEAAYYPYMIILLTAFGGFCSMAQIKGMLVGTSLSLKPYIIGKIIYIVITFFLITLLFKIKIFNLSIQ